MHNTQQPTSANISHRQPMTSGGMASADDGVMIPTQQEGGQQQIKNMTLKTRRPLACSAMAQANSSTLPWQWHPCCLQ
jgi:hypothetical protein